MPGSRVQVVLDPTAYAHITAAADELRDSVCDQIAIEAAQLAPVRTGRLRESISYDGDGVVSASAPYAAYVELGTSQMAAEPYLAPSLFTTRSA